MVCLYSRVYHRSIEKREVTIHEPMHRGVGKIENEPRTTSLLRIERIATETGRLIAWYDAIDWHGLIFATEETIAQ